MEYILNIENKIKADDSITSYQHVEYQRITGSQLNTSGQITIMIENTDDFYYPRHSWLLIEWKLVKSDGEVVYADADLITLTNNASMYLFTNVKYSLSGMEIESLNHPRFATTMRGTLKYSSDFDKGPGLMQRWLSDTSKEANANNAGFTVRQSYIIKKLNPEGSFSFAVPLENIFGFKVI